MLGTFDSRSVTRERSFIDRGSVIARCVDNDELSTNQISEKWCWRSTDCPNPKRWVIYGVLLLDAESGRDRVTSLLVTIFIPWAEATALFAREKHRFRKKIRCYFLPISGLQRILRT
jgi:hypothetical protein